MIFFERNKVFSWVIHIWEGASESLSFWLEFSVAGVKKRAWSKRVDTTSDRSSKFIKSEVINRSTNIAAFFSTFFAKLKACETQEIY